MRGRGDSHDSGSRGQVHRHLARIEARLQMPRAASEAILDELAAHLHDAIEASVLAGSSREDAEREALARLGSPEALGDDLRRTHQTTRRLLAAVGGGVFQGIRGSVRGWFGGYLASIPLFFGIGLVAQFLIPWVDLVGTSFSPLVVCSLWGATWLGGRYLVEHISRASLRTVEHVRTPIALVGVVAIGVAIAVIPMDQTVLSVAMTLMLPVVFAAGALTTNLGLGDQIMDVIWRDTFPSVRRVLFVGFATIALGGSLITLVAAAITGPSSIPPIEGPADAPDQTAEVRWTAAGYGVVAQTVLAPERAYIGGGFERKGALVVSVPTDVVDWDEWSDVRFEAWEAKETPGGKPGTVIGSEPYEILPVADPWAAHDHVVRVGQPGISYFLVFLTAADPATGERVAIGWPEGDSTVFHGSVLDWFAR